MNTFVGLTNEKITINTVALLELHEKLCGIQILHLWFMSKYFITKLQCKYRPSGHSSQKMKTAFPSTPCLILKLQYRVSAWELTEVFTAWGSSGIYILTDCAVLTKSKFADLVVNVSKVLPVGGFRNFCKWKTNHTVSKQLC